MVLVHKDKEALGRGFHQPPQALIHGGVPVPDLLQHHAHDDNIIHRCMLQEVDLQGPKHEIEIFTAHVGFFGGQ